MPCKNSEKPLSLFSRFSPYFYRLHTKVEQLQYCKRSAGGSVIKKPSPKKRKAAQKASAGKAKSGGNDIVVFGLNVSRLMSRLKNRKRPAKPAPVEEEEDLDEPVDVLVEVMEPEAAPPSGESDDEDDWGSDSLDRDGEDEEEEEELPPRSRDGKKGRADKSAAKGAREGGKRGKKKGTSPAAVVLLVLLLLIGTAYAAHVNGFIDLSMYINNITDSFSMLLGMIGL